MIRNLLTAASLWHQTKGLQSHLPSRVAFLEWQGQKLRRWLDHDLRRVPFYEGTERGTSLANLPIMDKARLMAEFDRLNRPGITAEQGWELFSGSRESGGYHIGASTGTSGNRGLFVISDRERYAWLGAMLGKLLPDFWRHRHRIAVVLPLHTRLYDAANRGRRLQLEFYDLTQGFEVWQDDLCDFSPTIIIAPPRALRWMAENIAPRLSPWKVYSGAEVLDPVDRYAIEAAWPGRLGQIYMATEGLLATSCAHGALHLAEDIMHFELEPVGDSGLVSPLITDFRRSTQIMCRYRMNDLLRIMPKSCECGSPLMAIEEVVGRRDDCFGFCTPGGPRLITPDVLRNAVLDSDRSITDFRIRRTSEFGISLLIGQGAGQQSVDAAVKALKATFAQRGVSAQISGDMAVLEVETDRKLRRVQDDHKAGQRH